MNRRRACLFIASAIGVAYPLLHKVVSDICDLASGRWGFATFNRVALIVIPLASILVVSSAFLRRRRPIIFPRATLMGTFALAAMTITAQRWLLVANIELVHLPQFALLAWVLLAAGLGRPSAYLASTAAGVLDETYQHLILYAGVPDTYFDINDIVLNAIGAAWAVVLLGDVLGGDQTGTRAFDSKVGVRRRLTWPRGAAVALAVLPVALWFDPPNFNPLLKSTEGGTFYRVLSVGEGLVICIALWGVSTLPTSDRTARGSRPGSLSAATGRVACLLAVLLLSSCATAPVRAASGATPTSAAVPPVPFITTFWCGPPLSEFDDARAAEIAAAGFTIVGPPCEGETGIDANHRALDVAARHGLKLWIADPRFNERAVTLPDWKDSIAAAAADYKDHQAFGGYFVTDEPTAVQFDDLAAIVARLREVDPRSQIYLNLLADYIPDALGAPTYREYVERFIATVRPSILSYDYYPFGVTADRPTFFSNLALVRELALRHDLPFMLILLAMPHGGYRDPTEAELSWQALHAVAFGARGISYFAYWTPVDVEYANVLRFRHGLIENGRPTEHYFEAMRINGHVRSIERQLSSFHSISVGDSMGEVAAPLPLGPLAFIEGAPVTAGLFEDGTGRRAVLLVNRDYRRGATVTLTLAARERRPQIFDTEIERWLDVADGTMNLPAGGAQLLLWRGRAPKP